MENLETPNNSEKINSNNPFVTEPTVSMGKNALYFGLILGGIHVVYNVILWILGLSLNKPLGYVAMIFTVAIMYFGTKDYRDKHLGGYMMYGKAFTSNFLIGLYASIIGCIFAFFMYKYLDPKLIDSIKQMAIDAAMKKNPALTADQMDAGMNKYPFFWSPLFFSISALVGGTIFSALLGLIVAIFHKKEKPLI